MTNDSVSDPARSLARLALAFEDMAADIRRGAEEGGLTLSEVRVLDGIARGVTGARLLSRRLRLDEGHVSRMVRRLREAGLLTATREQGDSRRVSLALTGAGTARLGDAIDGAASAALDVLGDRVAPAAPAIGRALEALTNGRASAQPAADEVTITALEPGDAGWVVSEHGVLYALEEAFDHTFEAVVARILADFLASHDPAREAGWIARAGSERVGCIFCFTARGDSGLTAQLRLFLVRPEWRGQKLGLRLLNTCRDFAVAAGYQELILHTHKEHAAACRLYSEYGFVPTQSREVVAYGRQMTEQIWALPLDAPLANGSRRV